MIWTEEKVEYAKELMKTNSCVDAYRTFNENYPCTRCAFSSYVYTELHLKSGAKPKKIVRKNSWSQDEIDLLENLMKDGTNKSAIEEFQKHYNRTSSGIVSMIKKLGLKSNPKAIKRQFKEGTEFNKKTRFKKGRVPPNKAKIGDIRFRNHKNKYPYYWVKISDTGSVAKDWILAQRYFYQKYHGEIPKGYKVIFADGDHANFAKENLKIVTNKEFGYAKKYLGESTDQSETGIIIAKIKARLDELEEIKDKK